MILGNQGRQGDLLPEYRIIKNIYIIGIFSGVFSFYFFYTFLFSKFLVQKKIVQLIFAGIIVALLSGVVASSGLILAYGPQMLFNDGWRSAYQIVFAVGLLNGLPNGIIALVMRGFISWYADIKWKEDVNKKNYEMELALVKSQINPHFLFNTINNIDILIEKDAVRASSYLNKLSDIMRFMLYETKTETIPLAKELAYIEKYIDLQKIRTANPNYVNYLVEGDAKNLVIAPMLFIPFMENAFKHAENKKLENAINIKVVIEKELIIFDCENNFREDTQTKFDQSGLGNELIQKRLMLLYPDKHKLEVIKSNNTYKVKLTINQ